ncbi:hypothetical protein T11_6138 [Trichinella zimbabwensis]|uniref:Uncharacterized protein n=1 Tax=Trichinella zimbabwensis TaxID=268475 RepID=A0A0V1GAB0_9BILA|nr:hypothetical protein T11_6138 [Trichinella zimbabwensis]
MPRDAAQIIYAPIKHIFIKYHVQRDLYALAGPVLATLIKRSRAELLLSQPCHVN